MLLFRCPRHETVCYMFIKGICQIMMVDVVSSCRDGLVFLLTLRWPRPPETTSTELTSTLLVRRPLCCWAGSCSMSYRAPSSGPCSKEPWEGAREPQEEEESESWRAMLVQPASPSHTPLPWDGVRVESAEGWTLLSSTTSVGCTVVRVDDGMPKGRLQTAAAIVRNLTGPLWACKDTIPRPKQRKQY